MDRVSETQLQVGEIQLNNLVVKRVHRKLKIQIFHPLEIEYRYRDLQLQVAEDYSYFFILRPNICKY